VGGRGGMLAFQKYPSTRMEWQNKGGGGDTSLPFSGCQWGQPGQCRTNSREFSEPGYELGQLVVEEEMYKYT
jgi:hypothetical protein